MVLSAIAHTCEVRRLSTFQEGIITQLPTLILIIHNCTNPTCLLPMVQSILNVDGVYVLNPLPHFQRASSSLTLPTVQVMTQAEMWCLFLDPFQSDQQLQCTPSWGSCMLKHISALNNLNFTESAGRFSPLVSPPSTIVCIFC